MTQKRQLPIFEILYVFIEFSHLSKALKELHHVDLRGEAEDVEIVRMGFDAFCASEQCIGSIPTVKLYLAQ